MSRPVGRPVGLPKTGGRKKGTPNKANTAQAARAVALAASGLTPLEYMLHILRNESADKVDRFEAAKAAAPYIHPRLAAIEHSGTIKTSINEISDDELLYIAATGAAPNGHIAPAGSNGHARKALDS